MENGSKRQPVLEGRLACAQQHSSERGTRTDDGCRALVERRPPSLRVVLFEVLCGLGLACNFVWCTLEGHADGFLTSAQGFDAVVNSRFFFQLGLALAAATMFAVPRGLRRADRILVWVLPALGALATFLYAWPQRISPAYPELAGVVGLTVSGFVYCWLAARFYLMMVGRTDFVGCVVATALCLGSKEVLLSFLSTVPPQAMQTCVAAAMPVLMAALCAVAARLVTEKPLSAGVPASAARGRHATLVHAVILALLLAVIRGFSRLGMWGIAAPGALGVGVPGVTALLSVCAVAAFAVFALILPARRGAPRFRPAMLVLLACLFPIAVQTYVGADAIPYVFLQIEELLAHLTFWSATCALMYESADDTLRTPAVPLLVYSATSAVLVVLMSRTAVLAFVFALLVVYLIFAASSGRASQESPASPLPEAPGGPKAGVSPNVGLTDAVGRTCEAFAATYGLSPREAQILPMVVEGRSRAYICNQLGLSDSTVKTHISHIYGKCSVAGRQGLVDLIFKAAQAE